MRSGRGPRDDPFLEWKVRLFSVAAVVGLAGIYFEERWMTMVAVGILAIAVLLRYKPRHQDDEEGEGEDEDDIPA